MEKFGKAQPVARVEDVKFLTGAGRYVEDIAPQGALHGFVLRSAVAHARIAVDVAEARRADGVALVLTAQDLADAGIVNDIPASIVRNADGSKGAAPARPILAQTHVRFVGEPIAMIFAHTLDQARDAAELIEVDYDELPVKVDVAVGGPAIHEEAPDNLAFDYAKGDRARVEAALDGAAHTVEVVVEDNRIICNSMEPRGCWAQMEAGRLHFSVNGQGVWGFKARISKALGMEADDVRVTNPDVGGGFGMKAMTYPENYLVAHAARVLNRPVRWMSERTEAMLSDNAGRDLVSTVRMGFDAGHKLVAYDVQTVANMGAYNSQFAQNIQTELFSKVLMGVYDCQDAFMGVKGVFTNTTQVDAYRGAGRPEAIYVLERAMDYAARDLGVDPWELRRRNFIRADQFPYVSATEQPYDVGDFHAVLAKVEAACDKAGFEARRATSARAGRLRGMGLCYYIESILGDPSETTRVDFVDGRAVMYVGTQSNGQGHESVYRQFLSDQTGIPVSAIEIVQGDSDLIPVGGGTGGSRSVTVQNTATLATVEQIITDFSAYLRDKEGAQVRFEDDRFRVEGSNMALTMLEVADAARADGREDLLSHAQTITLDQRSFPNGAHVAEVEIDPDTGVLEVVRYTVTDDFGNLINPMLVEGQIHGGVAQGIGQAVSERVVYDEDGQLLTATFMDYGMPRADDVPFMAFSTHCTPSKYNPMGMKGCGEAGTVGALAAVANAVQDAVAARGIQRVDMPFTPERMWRMLGA
ncbi:molybdopterin cofactor-binding domain-containing protein [Nereida sp. MMG025]|uniref:xanthine dehydrogenase family protein molybdopterin-binding subunit n=1 Tax=Nereida sp. MMG025 TaxID=2909981 RepID=UPI00351CDC4D|nr:xanthine dehydrogenase family protein molybdopterin-binding subunit [Nereida sp. MMG025]